MFEIITRIKTAIEKEFRGQPSDPNIGYVDGIPQPEPLFDMVEAYQKHPWVYAAVNAIANNFAAIDYQILMAKGKEAVEDTKHPFQKILKAPNPYCTPNELKEWTVISQEMCGNAYWAIERDTHGVPIEVWPLPPHMVRAVASASRPIDHYLYRVEGVEYRFDYDDMIQFKYINPMSFIYGQSSVLAARTEITADLFAAMWNQNFFKNSGRPDAILETDKPLEAGLRSRTIRAWKLMHQGVKNAHKMTILEAGLKYKEGQRSQKDMDFVNQRKAARETILAVFGVPPAIVGVLEYANYSNMEQQVKMFWQYTMLPKIRKFESTLTMRAAQITYRPVSYFQSNVHKQEALRPDEKVRSEIVKTYVDAGIPINNVIRTLELPFEEIEGGDQPRQQPAPLAPAQLAHKPARAKALTKTVDRDAQWKAFDDRLTPFENRFKSTMRAFFGAQKKRVLENLAKNADAILAGKIEKAFDQISIEISMLFDMEGEKKKLADAVKKPIGKTYFDFAQARGREVKPDLDFDLKDPTAIDWIANKTSKISREVNRFTLETLSEDVIDEINAAVAEGINRGETIQRIEQRINEVYDFAVESRAERIARTEVLSASNAGGLAGFKAGGADGKEWLSSRDDKVRDSHKEADGQTVGLQEKFEVGGEALDFPGDPDGDPSNVVNCRCTLIPVINDENA